MKFVLDSDQRDFAASLDALLASVRHAAVARAWADGDSAPGLKLWARLAELGVLSLATDATPVELVIAFEALGRHAVPGPWVESAAYLPVALGREVEGVATVALPPHVPYALDADVADQVYVGDTLRPTSGSASGRSTGPGGCSRSPGSEARPPHLDAGGVRPGRAGHVRAAARRGRADPGRLGDLREAAQAVRPRDRLLPGDQARAGRRPHRPRLRPAAGLRRRPRRDHAVRGQGRAGDAAYLASRTGLQVHGAIGYTQEFDLSLWITKVRALVGAWGTPAYHRARLLEALVG